MSQPAWSQDQLIQLLGEVELFAELPRSDLARVAEITQGAVVPAGKMLFEEGEEGDAFFIVFAGAVEILKEGRGGGHERLAVKRKGEGFGEMSLLNSAPRSASARTLEDTQLIVLGQKEFLSLLGEDTLAIRLLRSFSRALRALNVRFTALEQKIEIAEPDPAAVSRELQRGMLPRTAPKVAGYDVAGGTTLEDDGTGHTVWDVVKLGGKPAFVVLEVKNPGLPPAHLLGMTRTALRAAAEGADSVKVLLARANAALADAHLEGVDQFVECGVVLPHESGVRWSCAGKMHGGVLGRDGTFHSLKSHGPSLGVMAGFSYDVEEVALGPGDSVLVLSGGSQGLFRGAADLVSQVHGKPAGEVVATVQRAIRKASGEETREVSTLYLRKH